MNHSQLGIGLIAVTVALVGAYQLGQRDAPATMPTPAATAAVAPAAVKTPTATQRLDRRQPR